MFGALSLLSPGRWLLAGGLALALFLGYRAWAGHQQGIGEARATAHYSAQFAKHKADAYAKLEAAIKRAHESERILNEERHKQEKQDVSNTRTIADLQDRLRAAAGPGLRLRDPNAPTLGSGNCGGGADAKAAAPADDRPADRAEAAGLLSAELTGLLQRQAEEADIVNAAYIACREDALRVRLQLR